MKKLLLILFCISSYPGRLLAQERDLPVEGRVISVADSLPLPGASVTIKGTLTGTITDPEGRFVLQAPEGSVLIVSYIGYTLREVPVNAATNLIISLEEDYLTLGEVEIYSTGYQELPAERATGSFEYVDSELLNRSTGTDVISRLEGVTNSLFFDKRLVGAGAAYGDDYRNLRIRGISSINTDANPLIVVDNFPYEGDINNINPNDIESVTVLKDAAAASIWGARAANGVIVITTKRGAYNKRTKISFNSNVTVGETPDLYYNPNFLSSSDFIEVERTLFDRGHYTADENDVNKPFLSPVVEILIRQRDADITAAEAETQLNLLRQQDVRRDAEKYLYRNSIKQQYALNVQGGSEDVQYYLSGGYDKNLSNIVGNQYERITLNSSNTFRPMDGLEITAGVALMQGRSENNGIGWGTSATRLPYNKLADEYGKPLPVGNVYRETYLKQQAETEGLLDWQYRPLDEVSLSDNVTRNTEYRINTGLKYDIFEGLAIDLKYQFHKITGERRWLRSEETWYVRNLVNRFTQADGTQVFPLGDVLNLYNNGQTAHSARAQVNYNHIFSEKHQIAALAGAEKRQVHATGNSSQLIGYDDEVLTYQSQFDYVSWFEVRPQGWDRLSPPSTDLSDLLDRYISYYGNASYTYDDRYTLSGSARWDASNLFGVKTNQKGVPLWSIGGSWSISNEDFFNIPWMSYLRLRSTYGYNGNVNKSATAYVTSRYASFNPLADLPNAEIRSPGNPQLRWEKVSLWNFAVDYHILNDRMKGSLEYYSKMGTDLLGRLTTDPTSGFVNQGLQTNLINYASTHTTGIDAEISSMNLTGPLKWETNFLISHVSNEVTRFDEEVNPLSITSYITNNGLKPKEGKPIDGLYAIPWAGLDPDTGDPLVRVNDQLSTDYATFYGGLEFDSLVYIGLGVPSTFGAVRNTFSWKGFSFSFNITFKAGYYFKRSSINYDNLFTMWQGHKDFVARWKKPGDELNTQVPSMPTSADAYRDRIYTYAEVLFERGDHIRLQDISLSYSLDKKFVPKMPFQNVRIYCYASNLGILWRANKKGLDPDFPEAAVLPAKQLSVGINVSF